MKTKPTDLTGYSRRPTPVRSVILTMVWLSYPCFAHEALYYTAEIHLNDPETISVYFSIHAPEMMLDPKTDFSDIGIEWLAGLNDSEIETLIENSRRFVVKSYQAKSKEWNALDAFPLKFETADLIRKPDPENAPRPGCLIASLSFPNPGGKLEFVYSDKAEKRLLLAVIRPGTFPKTHDVKPGSIRIITLPEPPPRPWYQEKWLLLFVIPLAIFLIAATFQFVYSRRKKSQSLLP